MLITYFDEVKFAEGKQPYYWLGGIVASADSIWNLERRVGDLAQECFGSRNMTRETEFHAADLFHRKANFKAWAESGRRMAILKKLLTILTEEKDVAKIYVKIDPSRMVATDIEHKAFMFFVERVEMQLRSQKSPGILIGDRENDKSSRIFAESLSQYRSGKTPYQFGQELTHLIDTVHFTDSHLSRMLQLADLYVWSLQLCATNNDHYLRAEAEQFIRESTNIHSPARYKVWPTEHSWIQVAQPAT